ncbi:undecaprenyl-phosphate glucose phosphotransferase [Pleomorphovibrio marinus]|uniref:undecaprenyl-phosphate glucose phosphotransferase n=1 Tax=Pleomorphovibrio marinus TaxID=2164132 RepID=UPI000E0A96FC|nr:undecaprenyl-phosphate glucose phosphotransferase [Pleomorphovibrio marinus]
MNKSDQHLALLYKTVDVLVFAICFFWVRTSFGESATLSKYDFGVFLLFLVIWQLIGYRNKLYFIHLHNNHYFRFRNLLNSHFMFMVGISMLVLLFDFPAFTREVVGGILGANVIASLLGNTGLSILIRYNRKRGGNARKVLIVGLGKPARKMAEYYKENPELGYQVLGFVSPKKTTSNKQGNFKVLGCVKDLGNVIISLGVQELILSLPMEKHKVIQEVVGIADFYGLRLKYVDSFGGLQGISYKSARYGDNYYLSMRQISLDQLYMAWAKRCFDVVFASVLLVLGTPLMLLIAVGIKLESRGPVMYCPRRIGQYGKAFRLYKFRSMYENDDSTAGVFSTRKNDPRVTPFGKFLRKYSLDELPQFFNVLQGNMSVVGPRPHRKVLEEQFQASVSNYKLRQFVKPGITGWAQVNGWRGPTETSEQKEQRTAHDLWYIHHWSVALDIKIIYLTAFGKKTHEMAF